ncbi:zinc ribbon domain-containing protein [Actinoplanes regularis]|uniref:zinc ribbon domain-containing protein n=1 Tax=Actinoplanes regularis TaxID=52697 RepID=UPI003D7F61DC
MCPRTQACMCLPCAWSTGGYAPISPGASRSRSAPATGHRRVMGMDWGYHTLLTAVAARTGNDRQGRVRVLTDNQPIMFDATGATAKIQRLRTIREQIRECLEHYQRLLDGRPDPHLHAKHDTLAVEHAHVYARARRLGQALAWAAARWAVDHAVAAGCTAIYVDDLTSMEARGLGRVWNGRLGGHIRGQIIDSLRHLAAKHGLAAIDVPARGTSSDCPRCNRPLRHVAAPDRLTTRGHKWAYCPARQLSCDRDHAAAQRLAARGLAGQGHVARTRAGTYRTHPDNRHPGPGHPRQTPSDPITAVAREDFPPDALVTSGPRPSHPGGWPESGGADTPDPYQHHGPGADHEIHTTTPTQAANKSRIPPACDRHTRDTHTPASTPTQQIVGVQRRSAWCRSELRERRRCHRRYRRSRRRPQPLERERPQRAAFPAGGIGTRRCRTRRRSYQGRPPGHPRPRRHIRNRCVDSGA